MDHVHRRLCPFAQPMNTPALATIMLNAMLQSPAFSMIPETWPVISRVRRRMTIGAMNIAPARRTAARSVLSPPMAVALLPGSGSPPTSAFLHLAKMASEVWLLIPS